MDSEGNFSDHLNTALKIAREAARQYRTSYIGSEHILLGILSIPECAAYQPLSEEGVTYEGYVRYFKRILDHDAKLEGYTPNTKRMFELAVQYSMVDGAFKPLAGTEHMLLAILGFHDSYALKLLTGLGVNVARLTKKVELLIGPDAGEEEEPAAFLPFQSVSHHGQAVQEPAVSPEMLQYGEDLTRRAREGRLDPVIGRRKEIEKVIQILCRRTKNNPVLVGEPGVGKSAVAEGLAQAIVGGEVPELLRSRTVFSLNINSLLAGTRYRGDFEERLKNLLDAIRTNENIILFIDEIHMIVGAGSSSESTTDVSNVLKPMLARGEIQTIGATTLEEYRKYIEKDPALERRFTPVLVEQPSVEDTIAILQGLKDKYEAHHNVTITAEAIEAAARLSDRYITDRFLPDKAIDLIDEAASRERLNSYIGPAELHEAEDQLERLKSERGRAARRAQYSRAAELSDKIEKLEKEIEARKNEWNSKRNATHLSIGTEQIAEIVSSWTGVPVVRLTEAESERLMHLE